MKCFVYDFKNNTIWKTMDLSFLYSIYFVFSWLYEVVSLPSPVDYVYSSHPCRKEDQLCSIHCEVFKLKGDFNCEFCLCKDADFYVRWETTPLSTHPSHPTTTLPPDVFIVNNIKYHKISDPCSVSRDHTCPWACTETKSVDAHGNSCTMCDCKGWKFCAHWLRGCFSSVNICERSRKKDPPRTAEDYYMNSDRAPFI